MKEKIKDRYNILGACFFILGVIIILRLANLQIINGQKYDSESQSRLLNERKIAAPRGDILDRNGIPIATNRIGFTVQIVYAGLDSNSLNDMLLRLANLFESCNDEYNRSFNKFITFNPIGFGSSLKNLKEPVERIKSEFGLKPQSTDRLDTPEEAFRYIRENKYKIDKKYTDEEAYKIMTMRYEIRGLNSLNPITLARDVSQETMAKLEEMHRLFPGVTTDTEPIRVYRDSQYAAHILGYIRGINDEEYKRLKDKGYAMNELIGKSGVELAAEEYLRGKDGQRRVEVDTEGRFTEELNSRPAVPGNNVILTIDMKLQKIAEESLERTITSIRNKQGGKTSKNNKGDAFSGAVVALDVNNGEVLAMSSYPTFDPAIFLEGAGNREAQNKITEWNEDNVNTPLVNRAIAAAYPPGSTFKPIVAVAGLEEGVITKGQKIDDPGFIIEEGERLTCLEYRNGTKPHGHGPIDLKEALATSCNIYFYKLGISLGSDNIDKWSKNFGLGEYTGIELGGESKGTRSNQEYHYKQTRNQWGKVLTALSSIGQLYNNYTPLQLANYTATIANGGKKHTPHVIKKIIASDGTVVKEDKPEYTQLPVKAETIQAVKDGMEAVANSTEGTAANVFEDFYRSYNIRVAGKTGTAETNESIYQGKSNNGMFICYAPADNPKIAVAVAVQRGVFGYYAADVARDIMAEYFNLNDDNNVDDIAILDKVIFTR
ncbi:peptidoglycan glycosyltransferase [Anaerobacterium chartisolvens]|uniref:Peptidoglycan glycosyltransferase n=1 Tax=Anaerobacterium chartisolvens TaxID=1297424 RepID=A0A369BAB7_9FIRM|nr:penicillin-binding protein 2 [Anaerobacterium chartisolvens]RCX17467.1 peptidoglycan glycosyltransferase [Anaerobacterium chartisolvens]